MGRLKVQDVKMTDQIARHEITRQEIARHEKLKMTDQK